ncbi:DNA-3-methyladenine glycosylase 2 family protein, partial [Microbacterium lacticum]|uniref:DNA-3-methyladenine glycosylase family protein n=1 Tax=Microbacterium lacticum TaxID=33885 RepID=UPI0018B0BAD6
GGGLGAGAGFGSTGTGTGTGTRSADAAGEAAGGASTGAATPGAIELVLPHRGPLDADGLFAWMAARAVTGVESVTAHSFARTIRLPGGPAWFSLRLDDAGRVRLSARLTRLSDLPVLVARARRLFDLDADPLAVDAALSTHPELAPLVARVPGIRVPGAADPHEMLIRAMIGQQITVTAATTALSALTDALGERVDGFGAHDRLFPTMAAIAEHGAEVLRGPAARIRAITGAAAALADGSLVLTTGDDRVAQRAALLAMPGIGPWTADYVRMRVLGDPDITLPGDVAVRAGAAASGIPGDPRGFEAWAARTAPWRSYATAHLWRAVPPRQASGRSRRGAPPAPPHDSRTTDPTTGEGTSS